MLPRERQPTELLAPRIVSELRHADRAHHLSDRSALRHENVDLAEFRVDRLRLMLLLGLPSTYKWPESHSAGRPIFQGADQGHSRDRTDLECHSEMVRRAECRIALHRAGQTDARHGFVKSFNGRMRDGFLNETLSRNLAHARDRIAAWVTDCNAARPHSALG